MSWPFGLIVPAVIIAVAGVAVIRVPRDRALQAAVLGTLTMGVLSPSFSPAPAIIAVSVAGNVAVLAVAIARERQRLRPWALPVLLVLLLIWTPIAGSFGASIGIILLNIATAALLLLFALAVISDPRPRIETYLPFLPIAVVVESVYGLLEELGVPALWSMTGDIRDLIAHRPNAILPLLLGRAMGTTAQPIAYGLLVAFGTFACCWFAVAVGAERRVTIGRFSLSARRLLAVAALIGGAGIVVSGTRSAITALVVGLLTWLFQPARWRPRRVVACVVAVVAALGAGLGYLLYAQLSGLIGTPSFQHRFDMAHSSGILLRRDPVALIFGTGFDSIRTLLTSGALAGLGRTKVFDEEFLRTFVGIGLVGLILLIGTLVVALARASRFERCLLLLLVSSFFAYDTLSWRMLSTLFVLVALPVVTRGRRRAERTRQRQRARRTEPAVVAADPLPPRRAAHAGTARRTGAATRSARDVGGAEPPAPAAEPAPAATPVPVGSDPVLIAADPRDRPA